MTHLCFLLFYPKHSVSKLNDREISELIFEDAKITKGIGLLPISYEIGDKGFSSWNTLNVGSDDVWNSVHLRNGGTEEDIVRVEYPPCLNVWISLPHEFFSRLVATNWKEKFALLRLSFKYPAEIPKKLPIDYKEIDLPINSYDISWEEKPIDAERHLAKENSSRFPLELGVFSWRRRLRYYWLNDR